MSVCTNLGSDLPSRLAAYDGYVVLRTRDRRPHYLNRIVSMCISANFGPDRPSRLAAYSEQHAHPTLILRARGGCDALFHPCTLALRARFRGRAAPPRLRAARATRTQTSINCAHCPNKCLYQCGPRSAMPFGRLCSMCGSVHTFAHCINAHSRSTTPITSSHCPNECVYQFGARPVQPFGRLCWICGAARTFARAERA
jgi:hypothetical protein